MGALGHRRHGKHINKASRGHLGSHRSGIESYDRGNFPGHHVLGSLAKKSGVNGCIWMYIGSDGCVWMHGHGGTQKRGKKSNKWVSKVCFVTRAHNAKKNRKYAGMVMVGREDHPEQ